MTTENNQANEQTNTERMQGVLYTQEQVDQFQAQIIALYDDSTEMANIVLKQIPDGLKALIPEALSPAEKVKWFEKAKAAGLLIKPNVPETDTQKPALNQPKLSPDELPPIARMSMGYNTSK